MIFPNIFAFILVSLLIHSCYAVSGKKEDEAHGVILLDSFTFPKIVPLDKRGVFLLVWNKRMADDYGTASIRSDFNTFAMQSEIEGNADSVVYAQLIVNGAQNLKLAEKIGVPSDFKDPALFFFPPKSKVPVPYPKGYSMAASDLTSFLSQHVPFYFGIPGLLKPYSDLSKGFVAMSDAEKESSIQDAEAMVASFTAEQGSFAQFYVKIMKSIMEHGVEFLETEVSRLSKLLESDKISDKKSREFKARLNILREFSSKAEL